MRLLLLIIGIVLGMHLIFTALRHRRRKKLLAQEEFDQIVLQKNLSLEQEQIEQSTKEIFHDPLLDDFKEERHQVNPNDPVMEEPVFNTETPPEQRPVNREFIAMTLLPKQTNATHIAGLGLSMELRKNHFHFGKQKLFHRHLNDNPTQPILYSVASLVEPGYFDPENMVDKVYPGILIFMLLPCETDPVVAFEKMLTSARQLAASLNADLCDSNRCLMEPHIIQHYRQMIKSSHTQASLLREMR